MKLLERAAAEPAVDARDSQTPPISAEARKRMLNRMRAGIPLSRWTAYPTRKEIYVSQTAVFEKSKITFPSGAT